MATNQYGQSYEGNDDFRGWLAANGHRMLLDFTGNDGRVDPTWSRVTSVPALNYYGTEHGMDYADEVAGLYNQWLSGRVDQPTNNNYAGYTNSSYNAQAAKEAARAAEAQGIKDRMVGRRGELDDILNAVLAAIDATYAEESTKRKGQYDTDAADLLKTLNQALPEIAASFAAIGSYDSSWNNDSQAHTTDKYNDSQATLTSEYNTDMATLGNKANQARTDARTSYNNNQIDFDTLENTEANSDSLETLRRSENSLNKAINEFSQSQHYYKPGSTFAQELSNLGGVYDYGAIKNAFANYLSTAGAGATNVTKNLSSEAKSQVGEKTKKTEVQENTPTSVK